MRSLSYLIKEFIMESFETLKEPIYEGYSEDFWYVIKGCNGDILIGVKTKSIKVNDYVVKNLHTYLPGELGNTTIISGELNNHIEEMVAMLS